MQQFLDFLKWQITLKMFSKYLDVQSSIRYSKKKYCDYLLSNCSPSFDKILERLMYNNLVLLKKVTPGIIPSTWIKFEAQSSVSKYVEALKTIFLHVFTLKWALKWANLRMRSCSNCCNCFIIFMTLAIFK